jgi:hypothetical protein
MQVTGELIILLLEKIGDQGGVFADDVQIALDNPLAVLQGDDAQRFGVAQFQAVPQGAAG